MSECRCGWELFKEGGNLGVRFLQAMGKRRPLCVGAISVKEGRPLRGGTISVKEGGWAGGYSRSRGW